MKLMNWQGSPDHLNYFQRLLGGAFANVKKPDVEHILSSPGWGDESFVEDFYPMRWQGMQPDDIYRHTAELSVLTLDAYVYYLAAYLGAFEDGHPCDPSIPYILNPEVNRSEYPSVSQIESMLTLNQKSVVAEYFRYLAAVANNELRPEQFKEYFTDYWRKYEKPYPEGMFEDNT